MKLVRIFVPNLYAIRFNEGEDDEFTHLFECWSDVAYLEEFFENNKSDLESGFYNIHVVEHAVKRTKEEAQLLENDLMELSRRSKLGEKPDLDILFKPLYNKDYCFMELHKTKAKGGYVNSWLRIYAIRIDTNTYVITGGGIKLTKTMNDRVHLINELEKLTKVKNWLEENGFLDQKSVTI